MSRPFRRLLTSLLATATAASIVLIPGGSATAAESTLPAATAAALCVTDGSFPSASTISLRSLTSTPTWLQGRQVTAHQATYDAGSGRLCEVLYVTDDTAGAEDRIYDLQITLSRNAVHVFTDNPTGARYSTAEIRGTFERTFDTRTPQSLIGYYGTPIAVPADTFVVHLQNFPAAEPGVFASATSDGSVPAQYLDRPWTRHRTTLWSVAVTGRSSSLGLAPVAADVRNASTATLTADLAAAATTRDDATGKATAVRDTALATAAGDLAGKSAKYKKQFKAKKLRYTKALAAARTAKVSPSARKLMIKDARAQLKVATQVKASRLKVARTTAQTASTAAHGAYAAATGDANRAYDAAAVAAQHAHNQRTADQVTTVWAPLGAGEMSGFSDHAPAP